MKNSVIKQAGAFFTSALFLCIFTSSTLITDQKTKPQTSLEKKEAVTMEVRINDIINFNPIKNEANQFIGGQIHFVRTSPQKPSFLTLKEKSSTQLIVTEKDSCIIISQQGYKPLQINLKLIKNGPKYSILNQLDIKLVGIESKNISEITQKNVFHLTPEKQAILPIKKIGESNSKK